MYRGDALYQSYKNYPAPEKTALRGVGGARGLLETVADVEAPVIAAVDRVTGVGRQGQGPECRGQASIRNIHYRFVELISDVFSVNLCVLSHLNPLTTNLLLLLY